MKNKNISLIIGLSLPVLLILLVAGSIYLPQLGTTPPKTNFIYSLNTTYYPSKEYFVENHQLTFRDKGASNQENFHQPSGQVRLFFHDVVANKSREISFEEAQQLKLDGNYISSEGFQVSYGTQGGGGFFPFYSYSDYNSVFLKKENYSKKMNLVEPNSFYYNNQFHFVGWVTQ